MPSFLCLSSAFWLERLLQLPRPRQFLLFLFSSPSTPSATAPVYATAPSLAPAPAFPNWLALWPATLVPSTVLRNVGFSVTTALALRRRDYPVSVATKAQAGGKPGGKSEGKSGPNREASPGNRILGANMCGLSCKIMRTPYSKRCLGKITVPHKQEHGF